MSQENFTHQDPVTLDKAFKAMRHWRKNKHKYNKPGIPDDVCLMMFQLEANGYSVSELTKLFGLSGSQYCDKKALLLSSNSKHPAEETTDQNNKPSTTHFCEARVEPNQQQVPSLQKNVSDTKKVVKHLKSTNNNMDTYLDTTTIIVECIHPDGQRLKIHTTNKSIDKVMHAFFQKGVTYHD